MLNPRRDRSLRFIIRFEAMLPDALELERSHKRFSDAVLLGRVRKNELLMQAVGFGQFAIEFRGVDQRVVGSQRDVLPRRGTRLPAPSC